MTARRGRELAKPCRPSQRAGTAAAQSCERALSDYFTSLNGSGPPISTTWCCARSRSRCFESCSTTRKATRAGRRNSRHQPRHPAQEIEAVRARRLLSRTPAGAGAGALRDEAHAAPVRRALLSVSDKTGLIELARALARRNIEILSTGGTAQLLAHNGVPVREVADYTGFPRSWTVGSNPASEDSWRTPGPPRRGRRRHGAARYRAHRSAGGESLPVRGHGGPARLPLRRRGREHRHRRACDAARGGEEP